MNQPTMKCDRSAKPAALSRFTSITKFAMACVCFGSLLAKVDPVRAQGRFSMAVQANTAELLPPPRSVRQQLREADEAIAEERYSDAVVRLGDLLRRVSRENLPETAQDYFLQSEFSNGDDAEDGSLERQFSSDEFGGDGSKTVMRLARDRIGNLPEAGWEIYQLRYGPLAAKTLTDAEKELDWQSVEQVRREFFHTEAGYRASFLLAMREWLLGNPLAVSMLLDDVVDVPRALEQLGDQVVWLHAGATLLSDRTLTYPRRLPSDFAQEKTGDESLDVLATWTAAITERFSTEPIELELSSGDYSMLGATPSRNGVSEGQMPLSNPRWMLETSGSPRQERFIDSETEQLKATGALPPPSWAPLRVGDQLLMRTTERLLGVDHRTGKRVWEYPWFSSTDSIEADDEDDPSNLRNPEDPKAILGQRVWNDVPYGQLSSDGRRVFMIDDLELVESERINPFGMRGIRALNASKNTLVALDLATEGKLLWRLGADENTPSSLADAFFLGPPLPVRDQLYVMVELAGEVLLVCLDPENGDELWRQVLVSIESSGITTDPIRRVAGAMPTYHNNLLVCPTGTGITIAIDLIDRTLRWVQRHPRNIEAVRHALRPPPELSLTQLSQRWATSVAFGHGNRIALTPVESDRLIVVDAASGKELFRPQPRIKNLYLAGIRGDQYIIVRADRVMGYDLNTGTELWSTSGDLMQAGQRVSGRGVFGPKSYFLPTSTDELIEISTEDGHVVSRRDVRFPLGNLIAVDGEIISQATTTLAVSYGERSLTPNVNRILKENPDDFFATVRKAELLLELDNRDEALALLAKARTMAPESDEVILLSVEAMLGSLRDQKKLSENDIQTLKGLIDRPEQRAELLVLQVSRLIEAGEWSSAFDLLLELSELIVEIPSLANLQNQILPMPGRSFSLSSWIAARVAEVHSNANETTRAKLSDALQDHRTRLPGSGKLAIERRLEHFQALSDAMDKDFQASVDRLHRQGDSLAVERLAWGTRLPTDNGIEKLDVKTLLHLARAYSEAQWSEDRRTVGSILESRKLSDSESEKLAEYPIRGIGRSSVQSPDEWPSQVDLKWESSRMHPTSMLASDRRYAKTIHLMGQTTRGWQAVSDNNPLSLLNHHGIARSIRVEGLTSRNSSDKEITLSGGLMLVLTPSELIAIDLFRVLSGSDLEAVRWRRSLSADGQAVAKLRSETSKFGDEVYRYLTNSRTANADEAQLRLGPVLGDRLFLLQGEDLLCFDTVSGQPRWRTNIGFPGSGLVAKNGRVAVISERADRVISFDWYDGRQIETKPLLIDSLMTTIGNHALLVSKYDAGSDPKTEELHDPYIVEIFDPIEMKRVQSRVASPINLTDQVRTAGYGELIEGRYFGLLDDRGQTTVWDVLEGTQLADVTIPLRPRLTGMTMIRLRDRFVILPRCKLSESTLRTANSVTVAGGSSVKGATSAHCVTTSRVNQSTDQSASQTAKVDWSEAFVDTRGVTTHQPFETPMLLLARGKFYNASTAARRREIDIWGLQITTGKTLIERLGKQVNSSNPQIETDIRVISHRNEVVATIQNEFLTFSFSETTSPDQPARESDENSSEEQSSDENNPAGEGAAQP